MQNNDSVFHSISVDTLMTKVAPLERSLSALPLFAQVEPAALRRLARSAAVLQMARGTTIFRQGEPCAGLHILLTGQIKLFVQNERGDEKIIELVGPGESIGEAALLLGQPQNTNAEAIADSRLLQIGREVLLEETEHDTGLCRQLLLEVSQRLVERTRDLEGCMLLSGAQRVAGYLLSRLPEGVNGASVSVMLPAKKSIIASCLNLTQEHFSRILHEIQAAGLIEVRGREICILDAGGLRMHFG
jgi:CRP/FNR family transcriptional regulator, dissimilatory nitrate respiration regulator